MNTIEMAALKVTQDAAEVLRMRVWGYRAKAKGRRIAKRPKVTMVTEHVNVK